MAKIFGLSFTPMLIVFIAFGLTVYVIGRLALYYFSEKVKDNKIEVPAAAFIGTIATAWALSMSFAASDIWEINLRADKITSDERSSIQRIAGLSAPDALDIKAIFDMTLKYAMMVIKEEWGRKNNEQPLIVVDSVLQEMRKEFILTSKGDVATPIVSKFLDEFDKLQEARISRLSLGANSIDMYKWYLLLFLTLLTTITIAATHADKKKAGELAIRIYIVTAAVCLWIIALHANPYQGINRIHPEELAEVIIQ